MLFRSNDTATTEIYTVYNTLSLHDALPISAAILNRSRRTARALFSASDRDSVAVTATPVDRGAYRTARDDRRVPISQFCPLLSASPVRRRGARWRATGAGEPLHPGPGTVKRARGGTVDGR